MKSLTAVLVSLLCVGTPAWAALSCGDLKYGTPQYEKRMSELAQQGNFPGRDYTRHHEKFLASYCAGDEKAANAVVTQGRISAADAAAIRRLVALGSPASPPVDLSTANTLINSVFNAWARSWFMDRYVDQSARATEQRFDRGAYLLRGTFKFTRGGGMAEIPFSAALKKDNDALTVAAVCYNDTTSGMTDCSNSGLNPQSRQLMGAIVMMGIMGALSGSSDGRSSEDSSANASQAPTYRQQECTKVTTCEPDTSDVYGWHRGECHTETTCH